MVERNLTPKEEDSLSSNDEIITNSQLIDVDKAQGEESKTTKNTKSGSSKQTSQS